MNKVNIFDSEVQVDIGKELAHNRESFFLHQMNVLFGHYSDLMHLCFS
jgi:hypothetical protein